MTGSISTMRRICLSLAVLASATMFALLLGEVVARLWFWRSLDLDMEMWKYATTIKQRSDDPRLGHQHRANAQAVLMGVDVRTNRLGIRGPEVVVPKSSNTFRVVLLGDSFTMGWGVPVERTFAALLERRLNVERPPGSPSTLRYEVINLGVGNFNSSQAVALLRRVGLSLAPDLILLEYFLNDAEPLRPYPHAFLLDHSYLIALVASRIRRLPISTVGIPGYAEYYRVLYFDSSPGWTEARRALRELASIARQRRIPAALFLVPDLHGLGATNPFADVHMKLTAVAREDSLPVLDLWPVFANHEPDTTLWVTPADPHPNARAHELIANALYQELRALVATPRALP